MPRFGPEFSSALYLWSSPIDPCSLSRKGSFVTFIHLWSPLSAKVLMAQISERLLWSRLCAMSFTGVASLVRYANIPISQIRKGPESVSNLPILSEQEWVEAWDGSLVV